MPIEIIGMRVFIGAPGGLEPERECVRKVIDSVNKDYAIKKHQTLYIPVEWVEMTGGTGKPQSRIHPDIAKCDYCIIIFYNYMGEGNTIIEFDEAVNSKNNNGPMKEVVVFFKRPNSGEIKSQSDELSKVLQFKEKITPGHFFIEFNDLTDFGDSIKHHLIEWLVPVVQSVNPSSVTNYVKDNMSE
ncbi:MAG: hypothetical protein NT030_08095 [Candidatus Saganbacteria bacterium]|nr:hypothetical protein [Candidatus Saganbacteria bacterium]